MDNCVNTCKRSQACGNVLRCECNVQLQFTHNSQVGLQDLLDGDADVAMGRADITADMKTAGKISSRDIFKCVMPVSCNCPSIRGCFAHCEKLTHCIMLLDLHFCPSASASPTIQCHVLPNPMCLVVTVACSSSSFVRTPEVTFVHTLCRILGIPVWCRAIPFRSPLLLGQSSHYLLTPT